MSYKYCKQIAESYFLIHINAISCAKCNCIKSIRDIHECLHTFPALYARKDIWNIFYHNWFRNLDYYKKERGLMQLLNARLEIIFDEKSRTIYRPQSNSFVMRRLHSLHRIRAMQWLTGDTIASPIYCIIESTVRVSRLFRFSVYELDSFLFFISTH